MLSLVKKHLPMLAAITVSILLTGCRAATATPSDTTFDDTEPFESSQVTEPVESDFQIPESMIFTDKIAAVGQTLEINDFVTGIPEGITVDFLAQPDTSIAGNYTLILLIHSDTQTLTRPVNLSLFHVKPVLKMDVSTQSFSSLSASDFIDAQNIAMDNITFSFVDFDPSSVKIGIMEDYDVKIKVDNDEYSTKLSVTDATPPTVTVKQIETLCGTLPSPNDFIVSIVDGSEIASIEFETTPNVSVSGLIAVPIAVTDVYGNKCVVSARLSVLADREPPVFEGIHDIYAPVVEKIDYTAGVSVTDNSGAELSFEVDSSQVDRYKAGTYPVTYTATDASGNQTSVSIEVHLEELTTDLINSFCDDIIGQIITSDMSLDQKIEAVWSYTNTTVQNNGVSNKTDINHGAYSGFRMLSGDAYTFYCMNTLLFQRLGIPCVEVRRVNGTTDHWWNLVQFEDGMWYHLDSFPAPEELTGLQAFKMTEDDLQRYMLLISSEHDYYSYDTTLPLYEDLIIATDELVEQMQNQPQPPESSEDPQEPEDPETPEDPDTPEDTDTPEEPDSPESPVDPETPQNPPVTPDDTTDSGEETDPNLPEEINT